MGKTGGLVETDGQVGPRERSRRLESARDVGRRKRAGICSGTGSPTGARAASWRMGSTAGHEAGV